MSLALGIDVGGSKVLGGVVDANGAVLDSVWRRTDVASADSTITEIVEVVQELTERYAVEAVGVGVAGWVSADGTTVRFAPHLPWRDLALRDVLEQRCGRSVRIENDANAATWAEYRFGAARGHETAAMVTIGTGIGGGLVAGGQIFRGAFGMSGEWGHVRVVPDGRRCACGNKGCWEQYASGRALARDASELSRESPMSARALLSRVDGDPARFTGFHVAEAAADGDEAAIGIVTEAGYWLGQGIADLCAVVDPSIVVVGGGVADVGAPLLEPARARFGARLAGRGFRPEPQIVGAALGAQAGLIGAADLALQEAHS